MIKWDIKVVNSKEFIGKNNKISSWKLQWHVIVVVHCFKKR